MSEQQCETAEARPVSVWKRLFIAAGVFVLLLTALCGCMYLLHRNVAGQALRGAEAELDESDSPWRLRELEAVRPEIPDEENSARVVMTAYRFIPRGRPDYHIMEHIELNPTPPPVLLDAPRLALLEREMAVVTPAVLEARRLAEMPRGRHRLVLADNPFATLLPDQQNTRAVANILKYDALLLSHKGKHPEALRSCRALINAGRSLGDEPFMISQIIRSALVIMGCQAVEKTLALGEPPAADLARLQELLSDEEKQPSLLVGVRGERASLHEVFKGLAAGRLTLAEVTGPHGSEPVLESLGRFLGFLVSDLARREHPRLLALMNQAVEVARLPQPKQAAAEKAVDSELRKLAASPPSLIAMLVPATMRFGESTRRKTAHLRCINALLAVERYRRDKGDWPAKLADVTPKYLAAVPLDPFDGMPLRFLNTKEGVIIYSVGPDGKDDGGFIRATKTVAVPPDVGFQVWSPALRRQPAPPPGKAK